jgi:protein-S-isoprenylcysteine O-methyltransferase Ste14
MANSMVYNGSLILLAVVSFAALHSLTAGSRVKRYLQKVLGDRIVEGWYRLAYNLFSVVTIIPSLVLVALLPDRVLYVIPAPYALLMLCIQAIGMVGFLGGLFSIDLSRFLGTRQVAAYLAGDTLPLPEEPLQEGGVYAIVRHPLYLFALVMLWPLPIMTFNVLVFNVGATLYLGIGSLIEERRLLSAYGKAYHDYCQRVPWLIPWPFLRNRAD